MNADFLEKQIELGMGRNVLAAIWDTAGQEKFRALAPMYYRDASGAVLVYDVTFRESFSRVINWVKELKMNSQRQEQDIQIVIAGNKSDIPIAQHKVTKEEAEEFASKIGAIHILTSAKTGQGTNLVFETLAKRIMAVGDNKVEQRVERGPSQLKANQPQKNQESIKAKQGGCC
eukprot:TRINITY_DN3953_c0_g2_i1.p2 TRINITY_DN3953_c0_g2~~TRINITY_DN3953_c0_g2_i1.p2  ORF type:complete len:174 (+),score=16.22 TRINITY_DN3953_c0_g2_i1:200-721(+)